MRSLNVFYFRFHKWAIPLTWVLGLGLAIPAGALAVDAFDTTTNSITCAVWHGRDGTGSNFYVQLSMVIVGFFLPLLILLFPVGALALQGGNSIGKFWLEFRLENHLSFGLRFPTLRKKLQNG